MPRRLLFSWYNKDVQAAKRHISDCGSGPVCVFVMKGSRSIKVMLKLPLASAKSE